VIDDEWRLAMNRTEALGVLQGQLQPWRERSWTDLRKEVGQSWRFEVTAESGTWYQGEVQVFWDGEPDGPIRVLASVDDGGWRASVPLTEDFILAPSLKTVMIPSTRALSLSPAMLTIAKVQTTPRASHRSPPPTAGHKRTMYSDMPMARAAA
jgi:hypothetical protein